MQDWPRPARVLVLTGPLFAPAALVGPFAVAYQDALGLGPEAIGLLAAATAALGFVFLLAGSAAAERWGRLRALSVFDVAGFVVPFALLSLARAPGEVVLATLLGATAQGAQAGFQALLMADLAPAQRPRVLAMEHLFLALPSAAMPLLAGALVERLGLVAGVRVLYLMAAASVAGMVALRWALLRGTRGAAPPLEPMRLRGAAFALRGAGLGTVLAAAALLGLGGGLGTLAQVRVLQVLALPAWVLGPFAFATAATDLGATATAARGRFGARPLAAVGAVLGAFGIALFLAAGAAPLLVASGAVLGAAGAWAGLGVGALLHDRVPEALRDRAAAALGAVRIGSTAAGAALAGVLYARDAAAPWLVAFVAFAAAAAMLAGRPRSAGKG